MGAGALIAAYQEDDQGGLRALLPLAGQSLIEYQARCLAACDAAPILIIADRIPVALTEALERLRADRINVLAVTDPADAATRFDAGAMILFLGDGIVPPPQLVADLAAEAEPAVLTVPDDEVHQSFERIDAQARWAGIAVLNSHLLASTAAMLGDWDLQSTLLRRALQEGAARIPAGPESGEPLLVDRAEQLAAFEQAMITASRGGRRDFTSRYLLPPAEDLLTARLLETPVRPSWMVFAALALTLAAGIAFLNGWSVAAMACLVLSTPLDLVASRMATLRLRPLPAKMAARALLEPAAALALIALGYWESRHGGGWGSILAALTAVAFARAAHLEAPPTLLAGEIWLFSRRNAITAALPFALFGSWNIYLAAMVLYATVSFFLLQHVQHRLVSELTRD